MIAFTIKLPRDVTLRYNLTVENLKELATLRKCVQNLLISKQLILAFFSNTTLTNKAAALLEHRGSRPSLILRTGIVFRLGFRVLLRNTSQVYRKLIPRPETHYFRKYRGLSIVL